MSKIAIAIHGGAGPDEDFIKRNLAGYEEGLKDAANAGYKILVDSGSAVDAVQATVQEMENNPLFNAGRGSALNNRGEIGMDASLMNGDTLKAGAVSMIKNVKNPVSLASFIMDNTNNVLVSGTAALELAAHADITLETDSYFITEHQYDVFMVERNDESFQELLQKRVHGTVGAVALNSQGNIAAAYFYRRN